VKRATGQRHFLCRPLRGLDYSAIMDLGLTPQALCCTRFAGLAKSSSHLDAVSTTCGSGCVNQQMQCCMLIINPPATAGGTDRIQAQS
jgi:hypothetical protein